MAELLRHEDYEHNLGEDFPDDGYTALSVADLLKDQKRYLGYIRQALAEARQHYPYIYNQPGIFPEDEITD